MLDTAHPDEHPFVSRPHRTLVRLTLPVLISLIAEPLTGLADTAFIAHLGAAPLAALGVGTVLLSSIFWVFNFLGIGTQTEVARATGSAKAEGAREAAGLALALATAIGCGIALLGWPFLDAAARFMSNDIGVQRDAIVYLQIRLLAAPAVLVTVAAFGALRGLQDMRTPLWIALGINALNLGLDPLLIFGAGPVPALGIAGAAWATLVAQTIGAIAAFGAVRRRPGLPPRVHWRGARRLLSVGRDLFFRTGLLLSFILLSTRSATLIGVEAGAAHQVIRQVWVFTALFLDAYAATAQSLVAYFLGAGRRALARRTSGVALAWSFATGTVLAAAMLLLEEPTARLLVPAPARAVFGAAWLTAALAQPLNSVSFATDGILWGAHDYRYLRNAMFAATMLGIGALFALDLSHAGALNHIWIVTGIWISVRGVFGVSRIWPGFGNSPLRARDSDS
ncbi:MAG: MATE family efflux transporter [Deltaproteobacteria bacterium]|nr:MATE family efflux transporter [Deltaproteobacteria bacterium]